MFKNKKLEFGRDFLLYVLSFLLLIEWILPLPQITDTGYIFLFVLVTALFFVITFIQLPIYISVLIKFGLIAFSLKIMFFEGSFLSIDWVLALFADFAQNISYLLGGQFQDLTDVFRSFLFFLLLAILSYLLFYWTVFVRRTLFFFIFTIVYVAVIDTFTLYEANYAIIRVFIVGFLLVGLSAVYRMIEKENLNEVSKSVPVRLGIMMATMLVLASAFAISMPKNEAVWEDPMPGIRQVLGLSGTGGSVQRIGYGTNDERLGGGFIQDTTPLFQAETTRGHYWRGETKDYYTGHGWETTTPQQGTWNEFSHYEEEDILTATVSFVDEEKALFPHIFYPGEFLELDQNILNGSSFESDEGAIYDWGLDAFTTKVSVYDTDYNDVALDYYGMTYAYPTYNLDELREVTVDSISNGDIYDYYLQLPDELPDRVRELAAELIADETNMYDQAKAIERYLSGPDFEYETENVPVPQEGQDYVDQFLFETQRGYCDNFSTSMVVMLRANDIPARWVKGFTNGNIIGSEGGIHTYEVTNGNAHSWVEVYFEGIGWVPFEPTKGYTHSFPFMSEQPEVDDVMDPDEAPDMETPDMEEPDEDLAEEDEQVDEEGNASGTGGTGLSINLIPVLIALTIFLLVAILYRKKIVKHFIIWRFTRRDDEQVFADAYVNLLWYLKWYGYERYEGETLREYAWRIDAEVGQKRMSILTGEYERILYGGIVDQDSWKNQKQRWVEVVQKITA